MNETEYQIVNGTYYDRRTPQEVVKVLEYVREKGLSIRLHYGDTETGRDWKEIYDVEGKVSRSLGPVKVPLLVKPRAIGGPAILDHCIVKITSKKEVLYQHPTYYCPEE